MKKPTAVSVLVLQLVRKTDLSNKDIAFIVRKTLRVAKVPCRTSAATVSWYRSAYKCGRL